MYQQIVFILDICLVKLSKDRQTYMGEDLGSPGLYSYGSRVRFPVLSLCLYSGRTQMIGYTESQRQRLREYDDAKAFDDTFVTVEDREIAFSRTLSMLDSENTSVIQAYQANGQRNDLATMESLLANTLSGSGFMEFKTPTVIPVGALDKMSITESHPLRKQVFYVGDDRCLRPMLAPNLYVSMRNLRKCLDGPVRLFEIGSCFRKESHSTRHLEEFTMLNLVEMSPEEDPTEVLKKWIDVVMSAVGLKYELVREESDVYIETMDVVVDGTEVASGAVGPHVLDAAHGVHEPWCGVGFGLERLLAIKSGCRNIRRIGRSLAYLDGRRIDV